MKKIEALINQIETLLLSFDKEYLHLTFEAMGDIFNGAGPDWMSGVSRKILSFILRYYAAAFLIHDLDFHFNTDAADTPANRARFHTANKRMWKNIKILNAAKFGWYNPRRWWWRLKGRAAYSACQSFGWSAWIAVEPQANKAIVEIKTVNYLNTDKLKLIKLT